MPAVRSGEGSLVSETFDAREDDEAYLKNHLGPSPQMVRYAPVVMAVLALVALPLFGLIAGLILFGIPPPSVLPQVAVVFVVPVVLGVTLAATLTRKAKARSPLLPDSYTLDQDGIYVHRADGKHEWIDWDEPKLMIVLLDKRPFSTVSHGTTQLWKANSPYPVPSRMFDVVLRECQRRGVAGPSRSVLLTRGRAIRTVVTVYPQLRGGPVRSRSD